MVFNSQTTLFVPDTLPTLVRSTLRAETETKVYVWGAKKTRASVVFEVVGGKDVEDAERRLAGLVGEGKQTTRELEILAQVDMDEEGGIKLLDPPKAGKEEPGGKRFSVVLYSPLKHLEVLSLSPLKLDYEALPRAAAVGVEAVRSEGREMGTARYGETGVLEDAVALINSSRTLLSGLSGTRHARRGPPAPTVESGVASVVSSAACAVTKVVLAAMSYSLPLVGSFSTFFGCQLHTRLAQIQSLPATWSSFRHAISPTSGSISSPTWYGPEHSSYIRFFNVLWLIANDLILGIALSSFLRHNTSFLSTQLSSFLLSDMLGSLRDVLEWLTSWPMGIKLNDELAGVISSFFLFFLRTWEQIILTPLLPHLPFILNRASFAGFFGASSLLALSSDVLSVATLPVTICYALSASLFRYSTIALKALFNVFRGKKYNPLRHRTEPASYDVDCLLLGTLLFCTLMFLFPTLLAFYLSFLAVRLAVLTAQTAVLCGVGALNRFPLFAVLLRVKAPGRLPGGLQLDPCTSGNGLRTRCWLREGHLHLGVRPLTSPKPEAKLTSSSWDPGEKQIQPLPLSTILSSPTTSLRNDLLTPARIGRFCGRILRASYLSLPSSPSTNKQPSSFYAPYSTSKSRAPPVDHSSTALKHAAHEMLLSRSTTTTSTGLVTLLCAFAALINASPAVGEAALLKPSSGMARVSSSSSSKHDARSRSRSFERKLNHVHRGSKRSRSSSSSSTTGSLSNSHASRPPWFSLKNSSSSSSNALPVNPKSTSSSSSLSSVSDAQKKVARLSALAIKSGSGAAGGRREGKMRRRLDKRSSSKTLSSPEGLSGEGKDEQWIERRRATMGQVKWRRMLVVRSESEYEAAEGDEEVEAEAEEEDKEEGNWTWVEAEAEAEAEDIEGEEEGQGLLGLSEIQRMEVRMRRAGPLFHHSYEGGRRA
ncbi:hypothetical protein JCM11641_004243 [Rhodosporidiobolus odoratus]